MNRKEWIELAHDLFEEAYEHQLEGELDTAIGLYQRSIEAFPTAEAHTFLGWTYSFQGKLKEAIEECKKAIQIDPDFGNPYNDIGSYLIEQSRPEEAIPWLEQALKAKRYETSHFAYFNLGRAYIATELFTRARESFEEAIRLRPDYDEAHDALHLLKKKIQ